MKTLRGLIFVALTFAALMAVARSASAQATTGTVIGSVRDQQGAVVPGATVELVSEARGTRLPETFTDANGDFVFVNVAPDTYTITVTLTGFRTLNRPGVAVSPGDRLSVPALTIEVGGTSEVITVTAEAPLIQAQSGERSFTVTTAQVENLPIANRSFTGVGALAPGVVGTGNNQQGESGVSRIGGGGSNNIMMDGVSTMDTGSNSPLLQMNVESIAEVKVLVSNYQAEYGRASGLQITAVTRGGTNRFRGSIYDVERNSKWNSNSRQNILNGDPKPISRARDWGFSIGGPIGRPGGNNKLFFFYAQEFAPRTGGGDVVRHRFPTALERRGDFSQSTDNNGALFNLIRDPLSPLPCTAASTGGCFQDGGVLGRIPANRLYQTGLNLLNMYPQPNVTTPGLAYNYELVRPEEKLMSWQPALRIDYQPASSLRATFKMSAWGQQNPVIPGTIPGWNDTRMQNPFVSSIAGSVNYNLNNSTFLEATVGRSGNALAGCALAQGQDGTGPTFCRNGLPMSDISNLRTAGLGGLPFPYPNAFLINPDYYAFGVFNDIGPSAWNESTGRLEIAPQFQWGNRVANAPPNVPFPGYLNVNTTWDVNVSITRVAGSHTLKAGFYNSRSYKAQQDGQNFRGTLNFGNDTTNPLDSGFGFANAALGIFSSYQQGSAYVESNLLYRNTEGYIQDNWRMTNRFTLDYGVRLVQQLPAFDELGQGSNFIPENWVLGQAPLLYVAGCAGNAATCTGNNRQARHPVTGQLLGPGSAAAIGTIVPGTGNALNGLGLPGKNGVSDEGYTWPKLAFAPRFGAAYDLSGNQSIVLRGGAGLFFDRPGAAVGISFNPPTRTTATLRNAELQNLGTGLAIESPSVLNPTFRYDLALPSSWQWNGGVQMALPWATVVDIEYVGQHSYHTLQGTNINAIDFGAAFRPENQDSTLAPNATPGANAIAQDQMRAYRGLAAITWNWDRAWRTFHSLQLSLNRRLSNGVSFGFNDTIVLYDHQSQAARLQHNPDGSFSLRADQAQAEKLLGTTIDSRHVMKGNFVWDLPDVSGAGALRPLGWVANDWQLSGVWTGTTGTPYTVGFSYQNGGGSINLTGSPDYAARIRLTGDPGSGCSSDPLRQFNTSAFAGPLPGSVGLESGNGYVRGCFQSRLDLAIARNIRLPEGRNIQLRVDLFNAPNAGAVTNRNATMNLASPSDPTNATNLPFDAAGNPIASRTRPTGAGFGVATAYQNPRTVQIQIRFGF